MVSIQKIMIFKISPSYNSKIVHMITKTFIYIKDNDFQKINSIKMRKEKSKRNALNMGEQFRINIDFAVF